MITRDFEIICEAELEGKEYKLRVGFKDLAARKLYEFVFPQDAAESFASQFFLAVRKLQQINIAAGVFVGAARQAAANGEIDPTKQ